MRYLFNFSKNKKMKTYLNILLAVLFTTSINSYAQESNKKVETSEFKVTGVCGMCKKRIENAALIKGVKMAEWNAETQTLKVVYSTKKTDQEEIEKAVAAAGHDTENVTAPDDAYKKLPGCCAYRDGVEVH